MTDAIDSALYREGEPFDADAWLTDFQEVGGRCCIDPATDKMTIHLIVMGYPEASRQKARELHDALFDANDHLQRLEAVEAALKVRSARRYEQTWPDMPEVASFVAMCFIRLGGNFAISSEGRRYMGQPEGALHDRLSSVPQMPKAVHRHRFQSEREWTGALKLLSYALEHLSDGDRELVFGSFASVALNPRKSFDFREHLR